MLRIESICETTQPVAATLTLPFELRQKSRFKSSLDNGEEVGLFLPRGQLLRGGDCVMAEDGRVILIQAAEEDVSTVICDDPVKLARACYHLGNRHVHLQIADGWVRYLHDHVLDDMVKGLGLNVTFERAAFEPEPGAYGGGHSHTHSH